MFDLYENIENQVKKFAMTKYKDVLEYPTYENVNAACGAAYGAVQFAANYLFPTYNEGLGFWWENEMLPKFREIGG